MRKKYLIAFTKTDSAHLGEPSTRRGIQILFVQRLYEAVIFLVNCCKNCVLSLQRFARKHIAQASATS